MGVLLQLSWRNIWRHPARSGVLLAAIGAGLWGGLMIAALSNGFIQQRFVHLIEREISHIQVHDPDFLAERESAMHLEDADEILRWLDSDPRVRAYAARTLVDAMIQSPVTTAGVQIRGVYADMERRVTAFEEDIVDGAGLDSDAPRNPILLGRRLAERLNVGVGNRVVLTFQDLNGELTSAAFNITGVFRTGSTAYDERNVFVRAGDLQPLLGPEPRIHELAVLLQDEAESAAVSETINQTFPAAVAEPWFELSPELRYLDSIGAQVTYIIMVVILLAVAFGILNTMLMAIFERMRELGMLMAVGMNRTRIFAMIVLETVLLSLLGAAAGIGVSAPTISWFRVHGLDLSRWGEGLAAFGVEAVVYPFVETETFVGVALLVILTAILASIYPATKALRLNPAEAVRE